MKTLLADHPEYDVTGQLDINQSHLIYRAVIKPENIPIVLKILRNDATPAESYRLFREAEHLKLLHGTRGIVELHEMVMAGPLAALALHDIGGAPLDQVFRDKRPAMSLFFSMASSIVESLEHIHSKGLIHQDINPSNIVFSSGGAVQIIDFDLACVWSEESAAMPGQGVGTLNFMAPEQTGRTNRAVDFRSDFYSLGVTLFWLLSGELPFTADTAMDLVAKHLAKPAPLLDQSLRIPAGLSAIIDKLLQKAPEDRYQSAAGIRADLEFVRKRWSEGAGIHDFIPGGRDKPAHLQFPEKLYGREEIIREAAGRVAEGLKRGAVIWTITGQAGAGKSELAKAGIAQLAAARITFCEGKFDQVNRTIPYSGWSMAIGAHLRNVLALPAAELDEWRQALNGRMGGRVKPLFDIVPLLGPLMGAQPDLPEAPDAETRNRFHFIFLEFLRFMVDQGGPTAVFLDDLQWADDASLELIEMALSGKSVTGLIIIGAFRDEELMDGSRLHDLIARMDSWAATHVKSAVGPLGGNSITSLLCDTFKREWPRSAALAKLLLDKTAGNPYFFRQMLLSLFKTGEIYFDGASGGWNWNLEAIQRRPLAGTAVALTVERLKGIASDTLDTLRQAACLGQRFALADMSLILGVSQTQIRNLLAPALLDGFVLSAGAEYFFAHDRVRFAVYESIPPEERKKIHFTIGRALRDQLAEPALKERLLEVTTQLNYGAGLITDERERLGLARLNKEAETKARLNAAFGDAAIFIDEGLKLLPASAWESDYALAFALHRDKAQILYLANDPDAADRFVDLLMEKALTPLYKFQVFRMRIVFHSVANNFETALDLSLKALKEVGIEIPLHPSEEEIGREGALLAGIMGAQGPASLLELPLTDDSQSIALQNLLVTSLTPAYISNPPLFALLAFRLLRLSFEQGVNASTPAALVFYSAILASQKMIGPAYEVGLLALRMLQRTDTRSVRTRVLFLFATTIAHWRRPMAAALPELKEAVRSGIEAGDIEFAAYSQNHYHYQSLFMGRDLTAVIKDFADTRAAMLGMRQKMTIDHFNLLEQFALNLGGASGNPAVLRGQYIDEEIEERELLRTGNYFSLTALYMFQAYLQYHFGSKDLAEKKIGLALKYVASTTGMIHQPMEVFLQSLILGERLEKNRNAPDEEALTTLKANVDAYRSWAENCKDNYESKRLMAEAALRRAEGAGLEEILLLYEVASKSAEESQNWWDRAMAGEKAAEFLSIRGLGRLAIPYIRQAVFAYQRWGSAAKVSELEGRFKDILEHGRRQKAGARAESSSSGSDLLKGLDVETIINASRAMSHLIALDDLLVEVMRILVGNAGAQTGYLLQKGPEGWKIETMAGVNEQARRLSPALAADTSGLVSPAVVRFVGRTGQTVHLDDASASGQFASDAYIRGKKVRSLLCMPLACQGKTQAILYLENNAATHAFTGERVELLNILGTEAAISLRNASLFEELQKKKESLEESESFLRSLFDGTSAAVMLIGDSGVIECNQAAAQMLGVEDRDAVIGRRMADFASTHQPSGHLSTSYEVEKFRAAYRDGKNQSEWAMKTAGGREFYADVLLTPITYRDRKILHAIVSDVDSRVRFEKKNRQLDEERRFFTAVTAHELITPTTYLQTAISLIERMGEGHDAGSTALQVKEILEASFARLSKLAQNTALLNNLSAFDLKRSGFPIQVYYIVEAALDKARKEISAHKRDIIINAGDLKDLENVLIRGDSDLLKRLFTEVLSNAIKYSPDGAAVEMRWEKSPDSITMKVADHGIGLSSEALELLLHPYFSSHKIEHHHTSEYEYMGGGLGIGLVVAHQIASAHRANFIVESPGTGKGVVVTVTFPLHVP
ncbi:MAG: AAA family ATPase [Nitrospinae bacterium]|nr:AAA family ATPase [Nitrospinota bacterium]